MVKMIHEIILSEDQFPICVSHFDGGAGYRHTNSCHAEIEFQFICSGDGKYFIRDQVYEFTRNSVLLIHKNEIHSRLPGSCQSVKRINLTIGPKYVRKSPFVREIEKSLTAFHHIVLSEKQAIVDRMLLAEIVGECADKEANWEGVVSANINKVLISLLRASAQSVPRSSNPGSVIPRVIEHLDQCFTSRVTLDELAERFCLSKFWLSRLFKAETGTSIQDYIILKRIVLAMILLETTDMKVAAIASNVGFDDLSTFNRDFKLHTVLTPSEYRKISP